MIKLTTKETVKSNQNMSIYIFQIHKNSMHEMKCLDNMEDKIASNLENLEIENSCFSYYLANLIVRK